MWRRLVAWMQSDGLKPGARSTPLQPRPVLASPQLTEAPFSPNPGNLRMFLYLPESLKSGAPLVVVLHGCGQTANGYGAGAGWCELGQQLGFAVLAPEQKAVNNPNTCFNWFNPEDITRGQGECASIAAMIGTMVETHRLSSARVFITGLSAGGAMTAAMLSTYPELFAGGAIIAGLPFGVAQNVRDAMEAMRSAPLRTPQQWGDQVRAASAHSGRWPKISIWHGALDTTVNINNAQASVAQWANMHGLTLGAARQELVNGAMRLSWDSQLEFYTLPMLGHGTPIDSLDVGAVAPFILDAGVSSSRRIAQFWGLTRESVSVTAARPAPGRAALPEEVLTEIEAALAPRQTLQPLAEGLIRRALKAVRLLKR
ncbi:MAG TPA: PHB depolymerase family esterase [Rhizomicrobium sp.]|nr:PHB depolymerase family esterase [Rhizomicrobium sp.]